MKKGLSISLVISVLVTAAITIIFYVGVNSTFISEPAFIALSNEEKLATSYHNEHNWSIAHDDCKIVSIQKHYSDCYHILIKTDSMYWETCGNNRCVSSFKNGSSTRYEPVYGDTYSDSDYQMINKLVKNSDPNLDLNKINTAIQTSYTATYTPYNELISTLFPIFSVVFIIIFLIISIPTCIVQKRKSS